MNTNELSLKVPQVKMKNTKKTALRVFSFLHQRLFVPQKRIKLCRKKMVVILKLLRKNVHSKDCLRKKSLIPRNEIHPVNKKLF